MFNTTITVEDLSEHLEKGSKVQVIDCRFNLNDTLWGRSQYLEAHIPLAVYVHLDDDLSGEIIPGKTGRHPLPVRDAFVKQVRTWGISNDSQVVVYDQGHGGIAARAWWMLRWLGHADVAVLEGGWPAWLTAYPEQVHAGVEVGARSDFQEGDPLTWTVTAADVQDRDFLLIDARKEERYLGIHEPIDPVAGHIPGAINLPFPENLDAGHMWKSAANLRRRYEQAGLVDGARVVCYCGSGVTACHDILALKKAGLGEAGLYPGSWSEWIVSATQPHKHRT